MNKMEELNISERNPNNMHFRIPCEENQSQDKNSEVVPSNYSQFSGTSVENYIPPIGVDDAPFTEALRNRVLRAKMEIISSLKLAICAGDDNSYDSNNLTTDSSSNINGNKSSLRGLAGVLNNKQSNSLSSKRQNYHYSSKISFDEFHSKRIGIAAEDESNDTFSLTDSITLCNQNTSLRSKDEKSALSSQKKQYLELQDNISSILQRLADSMCQYEKNTEEALSQIHSSENQLNSEIKMSRNCRDDTTSTLGIDGGSPTTEYLTNGLLSKQNIKSDPLTVSPEFNRTNGKLLPIFLTRGSKTVIIPDNNDSIGSHLGKALLNITPSQPSNSLSSTVKKCTGSMERNALTSALSIIGEEHKLASNPQLYANYRTDQIVPISQEKYELLVTNLRVQVSNQQNEITAIKAFCKRKDRAIDIMSATVQHDMMKLQRDNIELKAQLAATLPIQQEHRHSGIVNQTKQDLSVSAVSTTITPRSPPIINLNDSNQNLVETTKTNRDEIKIFYHQQMRSAIEDAVKAAQHEYVSMFNFLSLFKGDNADPKFQEEGLVRQLERHHREVILRQNISHDTEIHNKNREIELLNREIANLLSNHNIEKQPYKPSSAYLAARLNAVHMMRRTTEGNDGDDDDDDIYICEGDHEAVNTRKIDGDINFLLSQLDSKDAEITALNDEATMIVNKWKEEQNENLVTLDNERALRQEVTTKLEERERDVAELQDELMKVEENLMKVKGQRKPFPMATAPTQQTTTSPVEVTTTDNTEIEELSSELKCLQDKIFQRAEKKKLRWAQMVAQPLVLPQYNTKGNLVSDLSGVASGAGVWRDQDNSDEDDPVKSNVETIRATFMRETANLAKNAAIAQGKLGTLGVEMKKLKSENEDLKIQLSMLKDEVEERIHSGNLEISNGRNEYRTRALSFSFEPKQADEDVNSIVGDLGDHLTNNLRAENSQEQKMTNDSETENDTVETVKKNKNVNKKTKKIKSIGGKSSRSHSISPTTPVFEKDLTKPSIRFDEILLDKTSTKKRPGMKDVGIQVALFGSRDSISLEIPLEISNTNDHNGYLSESKTGKKGKDNLEVEAVLPLPSFASVAEGKTELLLNRDKRLSPVNRKITPRLKSRQKLEDVSEAQNNPVDEETVSGGNTPRKSNESDGRQQNNKMTLYTKKTQSGGMTVNSSSPVFSNNSQLLMSKTNTGSDKNSLCIEGKCAPPGELDAPLRVSTSSKRSSPTQKVQSISSAKNTVHDLMRNENEGCQVLRQVPLTSNESKKMIHMESEPQEVLIENRIDFINRKKLPGIQNEPSLGVSDAPISKNNTENKYKLQTENISLQLPQEELLIQKLTEVHMANQNIPMRGPSPRVISPSIESNMTPTTQSKARVAIPMRRLFPLSSIKVLDGLNGMGYKKVDREQK